MSRFEDRLEPTGGELLDLLRREVDAVPLGDPRPDVAHDLLDIHVIAAVLFRGLLRRPSVRPASVSAAPSAMVMRPPAL